MSRDFVPSVEQIQQLSELLPRIFSELTWPFAPSFSILLRVCEIVGLYFFLDDAYCAATSYSLFLTPCVSLEQISNSLDRQFRLLFLICTLFN
jgi:hypothetical protein